MPCFTEVGLPDPRDAPPSNSKTRVELGEEKDTEVTRPYRVDPPPSTILTLLFTV